MMCMHPEDESKKKIEDKWLLRTHHSETFRTFEKRLLVKFTQFPSKDGIECHE